MSRQHAPLSLVRRPLFLALLLIVLSGCSLFGSATKPASFGQNNTQRQAWERLGITSYRTLIEVKRYKERRRVEAIVQDGRLVRATLRYWNEKNRDWEPPLELSDQQGEPYTVPGLFEMVGGELAGQQRSVAVQYDERYHFPVLIELGNVHDESGQVMPDTKVIVRVLEFEPLK